MTDWRQEFIPTRGRRSFAPRGGHPTVGRDEIVALKANACDPPKLRALKRGYRTATAVAAVLVFGFEFCRAYETVPQLRASIYGSSEGIKCPVLIEPGQSFGPFHLGMTRADIERTGLVIKQVKDFDRHYLVGTFSVTTDAQGIVNAISAQLGDLPSSCVMVKKFGYIPNFGDVDTLKKYFEGCGPMDVRIGGSIAQCRGVSIGTGWSDESSLSLTVESAASLHGQTNAPNNEELVNIARGCFSHDPVVYLQNRRVLPTDSHLKNLGFSAMTFETHAPARIYHFAQDRLGPSDQYLKDRYVVYWSFGEECEYRGEGGGQVAGWFLRDGTPCFHNHYEVAVVISPELRPERIDVKQKLSMLIGPNAVIRPSGEKSSSETVKEH